MNSSGRPLFITVLGGGRFRFAMRPLEKASPGRIGLTGLRAGLRDRGRGRRRRRRVRKTEMNTKIFDIACREWRAATGHRIGAFCRHQCGVLPNVVEKLTGPKLGRSYVA